MWQTESMIAVGDTLGAVRSDDSTLPVFLKNTPDFISSSEEKHMKLATFRKHSSAEPNSREPVSDLPERAVTENNYGKYVWRGIQIFHLDDTKYLREEIMSGAAVAAWLFPQFPDSE